MTKSSLIRLAGLIWFITGLSLMALGMKFLLTSVKHPVPIYLSKNFSLIKAFPAVSHKVVVLWIVVVGLCIGYFKGKYVFKRSVASQVQRINKLSTVSLKYLYSPGYYFLISAMMGLGLVMRFLPITLEIRGGVDLAIGSALLQGALHYFRFNAISLDKERL